MKPRENNMMKAGRIHGPGQAAVETVAIPEVNPNDVLIEVKAAGICGTDLHILEGQYEAIYPLIPGHEFSGVVKAVGGDVHYFKPGDRVTADPNIPCSYCAACQRNEPNQCQNLAAVGVTRDGGFAEYVAVTESNVFAIGDLSYKAAALIEPLACVVWGLKRVQVQPGDSVLVLGAGPMGCLLMQAVRQAGAARVVVVDIVPHRLEMAQSLGATEVILSDEHLPQQLRTLAPQGFDIVAEVTGIPHILEQAFDYVRPRGKVWVFGVCPPEQQASFNPYQVFRKDLSIIGSFAVNRTFHESIALIQGGAIQVEPLVSHVLPLDDFVQGLEIAAHDPRRMKIQFEINR
jgi:D-arabinitol dehydrogenase (NADP+)